MVNCAGRTRSIIGAQSLINAGLPNKVLALRNGTMGWSLAGFACDSGKNRRAPKVSPQTLEWARAAALGVAQRCGVVRVDRDTFERWRGDETRTLYLIDVRDPAEYEAGHIAGAISAPGGQLVQATDQYVGTLGARVVLADDAEVRALMTASWLRQMGFVDVFVLAERGGEAGIAAATALTPIALLDEPISCAALAELLSRDAATVVDLAASRNYLKDHIPGAWFAIRTRLDRAFKNIAPRGTLVLTSEDGEIARLALAEAKLYSTVRCAIWRAAMRPGARPAARYRAMPGWPTRRSISGASLTSAAATPRRPCANTWRGRSTCCRKSNATAR